MQEESGNAGAAIVYAGTLCGVLDGFAAVGITVAFGGKPIWAFQGIARGILGNDAYAFGWPSALVGGAVHFIVAFCAAAAYYIASRYLPVMRERVFVCGAAFGIALHLFMQFVVIPHSAIGWHPILWPRFLAVLAAHVFIVGPSIALTIRRYGP